MSGDCVIDCYESKNMQWVGANNKGGGEDINPCTMRDVRQTFLDAVFLAVLRLQRGTRKTSARARSQQPSLAHPVHAHPLLLNLGHNLRIPEPEIFLQKKKNPQLRKKNHSKIKKKPPPRRP